MTPPPTFITAPEITPVATYEPQPSLPDATPGPQAAAPSPEPPAQTPQTRSLPPPQLAVTPKTAGNETAPNIAPQAKGGVRLAAIDEVSVRVHLLDYGGNQKPQDTEVILGKTYVYFKSPSLKRTTQPHEDAKPHYPEDKPDYIHGAVILKLLVDEAGKLEKAVVVCSNPTFEQSAIASIENMRFTPAQNAGGPVKSYMIVEFGYGRGFPCSPVPDLSPSK